MPKTESNLAKRFPQGGCTSISFDAVPCDASGDVTAVF